MSKLKIGSIFNLLMKNRIKILVLLPFMATFFSGYGQERDTIRVMAYNLLRFPSVSPSRIDTLKSIVAYTKPDIFMVCELTNEAGASAILFDALNEDGVSIYDMADFIDGPNTQNELYYNTEKLVLYEQNVIPTVLRDINEYVLYYKSADLATTLDTTFFYAYVCHLKASSGFEAQRNNEITALKTYLATRPHKENILVGGDFNFYGSAAEPAWNTLLNEGDILLKDTIFTPGDWHANSSYAWLHTQSTRTTDFGGGAYGGMDDRFDFIFISDDLRTYQNGARFINGSYQALGQDGLHYNSALIDAPANTSVPPTILSNLYYMSDHLPVVMDIEVVTEGLFVPEDDYSTVSVRYDFKLETIRFNQPITGEVRIYATTGALVNSVKMVNGADTLSVANLPSGIYILQYKNVEFKFVRN